MNSSTGSTPTDELKQFADQLAGLGSHTRADYAVALLWFHELRNPGQQITATELTNQLNELGLCQRFRPSYLVKQFKQHSDVVRTKVSGVHQIRATSRAALDERYSGLVSTKRKRYTDSVLDGALAADCRGCVKELVRQINGSYDSGFFDATAVLSRRLMEILLIDCFRAANVDAAITRPDGTFEMLDRIVAVTMGGQYVKVSRSGKPALESVKKVGDTAAHSPYHTTMKQDIDGIATPFRALISELLEKSITRKK